MVKKIQRGRLHIQIGVMSTSPGRRPICRVCATRLNPGDKFLSIHPIGETPAQFHQICFLALADELNEIIENP